jgi:hypothetical protein
MVRGKKRRLWRVGLPIIALVSAACAGAGTGSSGSGALSMGISSPEEGAELTSPFTVTVDASVPLGDPSTGRHHVHLCFDGANCDSEYQLVYGDSFEVGELSSGEHTIEASLRNADHTDAGVTDTVTVTVSGDSPDSEGGDGRGVDY